MLAVPPFYNICDNDCNYGGFLPYHFRNSGIRHSSWLWEENFAPIRLLHWHSAPTRLPMEPYFWKIFTAKALQVPNPFLDRRWIWLLILEWFQKYGQFGHTLCSRGACHPVFFCRLLCGVCHHFATVGIQWRAGRQNIQGSRIPVVNGNFDSTFRELIKVPRVPIDGLIPLQAVLKNLVSSRNRRICCKNKWFSSRISLRTLPTNILWWPWWHQTVILSCVLNIWVF